MDENCIFCKLANGGERKLENESETAVVFKSIAPKASIHLLVVPKKHVLDMVSADKETLYNLTQLAKDTADKLNLKGYKIIGNMGTWSEVKHLHLHLVGGEVSLLKLQEI